MSVNEGLVLGSLAMDGEQSVEGLTINTRLSGEVVNRGLGRLEGRGQVQWQEDNGVGLWRLNG